jgi:hypothetical protein
VRVVERRGQGRAWFRIALVLIAGLLLAILVLLPLSVSSVVTDITEPAEGKVYNVSVPVEGEGTATQSRLHVSVVALDEFQLRATLRVSGHQICRPACTTNTQIVFFSFRTYEAASAGMPPSAAVTLPPTNSVITQTIELPIRGYPNRYPFDTYELWLAVAVLRALPDGTIVSLEPVEATDHLFLTLQEQLPRENMVPPTAMDPAGFADPDDVYAYALAERLRFERPFYVRVLAVLLVLLIAAAAAYAVFMRPLHELVINAGGLVLGVWGIRAILTPDRVSYLTATDLALALVILFLLGAITVRALEFCYPRSDVTLLPRWPAGPRSSALDDPPRPEPDGAAPAAPGAKSRSGHRPRKRVPRRRRDYSPPAPEAGGVDGSHDSSSRGARGSRRSRVSNPSLNQP